MPVPWSFLLAVALLLLPEFLGGRLPAPARWFSFGPALAAACLPLALALIERKKRIAWQWHSGARGRHSYLLRLAGVPIVAALLVWPGDLPELVAELAPTSWFLRVSIMLAPVLLLESVVVWIENPATATNARLRFALMALLTGLLLIPAALSDLASMVRPAEVFFLQTTAGSVVGYLVLIAVLCVCMPLLFRVVLPVSRRVPPFLLRAGEALRFPPRAMFVLETEGRLVNAAMVGPLTWPRYLVLTDGLLSVLDPMSLRGVVAHEVAHARSRHPLILLLLVGVVPLFLMQAIITLAEPDGWVSHVALGALVLGMIFAVRTVAHRFEFEADQLSAEALGGAAPCVEALRGVGRIVGANERGSWRHPSESARILNLATCESDPEFRRAFHRRGRRLRWATAVLVVVSACLCAVAIWRRWPWDKALFLFYTGEFVAAAGAIAGLPSSAHSTDEELRRDLQARVAIVTRLAPASIGWSATTSKLGDRVWNEGLELWRAGSLHAAVAHLELGLAQEGAGPLHVCLVLLCRARAEANDEEAERIAAHVASRFQIPSALADLVFKGDAVPSQRRPR